MANLKNYDADKLDDLERNIREREAELFDEINDALRYNNTDLYNCLKQEQLQCTAELRLIKYIQDGMTGDFLIC